MTDKTCPFHQGIDNSVSETSNIVIDPTAKKCDGAGCQLWVSVGRNRIVEAGETKFADPEYEYHYDGCGLLQVVPWELVKKEKKP